MKKIWRSPFGYQVDMDGYTKIEMLKEMLQKVSRYSFPTTSIIETEICNVKIVWLEIAVPVVSSGFRKQMDMVCRAYSHGVDNAKYVNNGEK